MTPPRRLSRFLHLFVCRLHSTVQSYILIKQLVLTLVPSHCSLRFFIRLSVFFFFVSLASRVESGDPLHFIMAIILHT
ncbi:hypothetical protein BJ508DRAFT_125032 [Ascobolus immersus RN42]|uniref:Uncharacterized protein n=1 Tax=Ascobolus immersus RN42 TaxID=1160509 RepID=A0A3N4I5J4_ASCIM|nr:hypothetical protein BJ508DRAFT_125032 [Ascobolus immersus RN42]